MTEMKEFAIKLPEDVGRFFFWLVFDCKVNFHPDEDFENYVSEKTGERTFSDEQCRSLNAAMEESFKVCEQYQRDIYEIAIRTFGLYHYCDGNDALANLGV